MRSQSRSISSLIYRICRRYVNRVNNENNGDMRTNGELRFMRETVPKCSTVFDVGANIGEWSSSVLHMNPRVTLHCFEPSLKTYTKLQENFKDKYESVTLNNFALGAVHEVRSLQLFGDYAGTNSLYQRHGTHIIQSESESVEVVTLDQYCKDKGLTSIDLLKLDVEGHELAVLQGSTEMLRMGQVARIQLEYGGCFIDARILLKDIFDFLTPFGFGLYKMYPDCLVAVDRYEQRFENFQYQNWVALLAGASHQMVNDDN